MRVISQDFRGQDLGSLWREAERLGAVTVEQDGWRSPATYKVKIRFDRAGSGSTVWAAGVSQTIEQAMSRAIEEARELGANMGGGSRA